MFCFLGTTMVREVSFFLVGADFIHPFRIQKVLKMISAWPLTGRMHQIRTLAASENPWKTRGENLEPSRCSHGQPWPPHRWRSSLWGSKQVMGVWQWLKGRMVD